ncbi:MAG: fumarylacetoacetate hydrolase family protein [Candidatus Omnitrophica bacterium]|jgi:2-keto-4-pentenoate hydratase/2-oxohepta-3-ene-1,7-dioic acid hydratase in catechol pathway|nr:fumarylacetoacetate hydrolase family protein [Candidatus Omnitrophota bacterium]
MRIARFSYRDKQFWGVISGNHVQLLKEQPYSGIRKSNIQISLSKIKFLVPAVPQKIILVGLNYKDHAKELNMPVPKEPVIFIKPVTSLIAHQEEIIYPAQVKRLDYEAELALVIKKKAKNISPQKAVSYILGFTCLNDVTARDIQKKDRQWTRAKSFDTFCPVGPYLETDINPKNLFVKSYLNGKIKQDSNTSNFIFPVNYLVSFISSIMTLYPGDIISTGTPFGVGSMRPGDLIEIEIQGIGRLVNRVKKIRRTA